MTNITPLWSDTVGAVPGQRGAAPRDTFSLIRRWQEYLEIGGKASEVTRRQYRRYLLGFLADALIDLTTVTEDDVIAVLAEYPANGQMRGQTLRALKSFYSWAEDREICLNPVRRLRLPKRKYGPAPTLSREEVDRLLIAADKVDPRARWTLQLAYATGARVSSLCAVRREDVDLERGWIEFRVAKGDLPYGIPLGAKGKEAAEHLIALIDFKPNHAVMRKPTLVGVGPTSVWNWATKAGELAGLKVWPHLLRHTFATRLAEAGTDVRTWTELMNHSDGSLLRRYAAPSDPNLRRAVESL